MPGRISKAVIVVLSTLIAWLCLNSFFHAVCPSLFIWSEEDLEEREWVATSKSWIDRKLCRFFGLCGISHIRWSSSSGPPSRTLNQQPINGDDQSWREDWTVVDGNWTDISDRNLTEIPEYVFEYAPLVHLFSREKFWPSDIADHLVHTTPYLNYTPVQASWKHPTLRDLDELNRWQEGRYVYLTSKDNVEERPDWLGSSRNIPRPYPPSSPGDDPNLDDPNLDMPVTDTDDDRSKWYDVGDWKDDVSARVADLDRSMEELRRLYGGKPIYGDVRQGGRSDAPVVLIVVDKGHGVIDAFWFFFYSYNLGNMVLNVRFGNHVGDWEHCMVRFYHGRPKALFLSAHTAGEAFSYEAMEKRGKRPVIYSATGTHAMYATPGIHEYILPWGLLHDETDRGPLWDPLQNIHSYTYNYLTDELNPSTQSPTAPTEWFYFNGRWGDKFYPLGDRRQYRFGGQYHYVNGPLGPRFKHLGRRKVCQGRYRDSCVIRNFIHIDGPSGGSWSGLLGDELADEPLEEIEERRAAAWEQRQS
ncbi:hypothetical protein VTN49DRAFT_3378 [Thermomyces lanuginosus]|uniref:uncharacterized protein n=1 Tax=Thermomyces lanuginosus TaxID=5541 RepID=UPI003742FE90